MISPQNREHLDRVLPIVYDQLRELASKAMSRERQGHTLQTTELVHETYMRLARLECIDWQSRDDLVRVAVAVMRRVLVDHARAVNAQKRVPRRLRLAVPVDEVPPADDHPSDFDLLALDLALESLREHDARKAAVVELKTFGGQSNEEVAKLMKISIATVKRDWVFACAWLKRELTQGEDRV